MSSTTRPTTSAPSTLLAADYNPPHPPAPEPAPTKLQPSRIGWQLFRTGISQTTRYPQLLLLSWAVNFLAALLLATLPALTLATGPGDRPIMHDLADGVDGWFLIESLMSSQAEAQLAQVIPGEDLSIGLGAVFLSVLLALLALPILAWLAGAFLQGGILLTYHTAPSPFRWRRFLWACRHWWGPFLLLGVAQGLAALLFLVPLVIGAAVAFVAGNPPLGWLLVIVALVVDLLGLALFESTRVLSVVSGSRSAFGFLGRAVRFLIRRPMPIVVLYIVTLLFAALLHAVYRLGLLPILPLDVWPLALLVAQTFLAARIATRLLRLAGVTILAHAAYPAISEGNIQQ